MFKLQNDDEFHALMSIVAYQFSMTGMVGKFFNIKHLWKLGSNILSWF